MGWPCLILLGSLCLVLHGHLPYVLHHGSYPHGEAWLYEAAAETYLPLLDLIDEVAGLHATAALTIGLTPVLLEQLAHQRFKTGFIRYLNGRADAHETTRGSFGQSGRRNWWSWQNAGNAGIQGCWNILSASGGILWGSSVSGERRG